MKSFQTKDPMHCDHKNFSLASMMSVVSFQVIPSSRDIVSQPVKGEFANKPRRLYTLLNVYAMGKGIRCMGYILCVFITSAHCGYTVYFQLKIILALQEAFPSPKLSYNSRALASIGTLLI